jgi:hypothetical protein
MLLKRRCERTGVINFFSDREPLLAAGSIVQIAPTHYIWRLVHSFLKAHVAERKWLSRKTQHERDLVGRERVRAAVKRAT